MARLKFPVTFDDEQTLLKNILAEHKRLGAKSPLTLFAKQKKMDLGKLEATLEPAAAQNKASGSLRSDSEADTQERDALLATPEKNLHGEVDYLKRFYKGEERELGKWGVTVDGESRIHYPVGVVATAELIQTFIDYHLSLEDDSPLLLYLAEHDEIDVEDDRKAAVDAIDKNAERNKTTGDSELATQERDKIWEPVVKAMHLIGDFLVGLYGANSRKLAAWGFVVVEDGGKEKEQASTLDPLVTRVQKSVAIPSVFKNVGEDVLHLWRGDKKEGEPMVVKPGGELGMTKGYSTIVVYNPSTLVVGRYLVVINR